MTHEGMVIAKRNSFVSQEYRIPRAGVFSPRLEKQKSKVLRVLDWFFQQFNFWVDFELILSKIMPLTFFHVFKTDFAIRITKKMINHKIKY